MRKRDFAYDYACAFTFASAYFSAETSTGTVQYAFVERR